MYCHERGENHHFDTVRGRMNAARHCDKCSAISLDWDDVDHIIHDNGVVEVLDVEAYLQDAPDASVITDGTCGRSWDDGVVTGVTPAPSRRCPFEYDHDSD